MLTSTKDNGGYSKRHYDKRFYDGESINSGGLVGAINGTRVVNGNVQKGGTLISNISTDFMGFTETVSNGTFKFEGPLLNNRMLELNMLTGSIVSDSQRLTRNSSAQYGNNNGFTIREIAGSFGDILDSVNTQIQIEFDSNTFVFFELLAFGGSGNTLTSGNLSGTLAKITVPAPGVTNQICTTLNNNVTVLGSYVATSGNIALELDAPFAGENLQMLVKTFSVISGDNGANVVNIVNSSTRL